MPKAQKADTVEDQLAELRKVLVAAQECELATSGLPDSSEHLEAALVVARIADRIEALEGKSRY